MAALLFNRLVGILMKKHVDLPLPELVGAIVEMDRQMHANTSTATEDERQMRLEAAFDSIRANMPSMDGPAIGRLMAALGSAFFPEEAASPSKPAKSAAKPAKSTAKTSVPSPKPKQQRRKSAAVPTPAATSTPVPATLATDAPATPAPKDVPAAPTPATAPAAPMAAAPAAPATKKPRSKAKPKTVPAGAATPSPASDVGAPVVAAPDAVSAEPEDDLAEAYAQALDVALRGIVEKLAARESSPTLTVGGARQFVEMEKPVGLSSWMALDKAFRNRDTRAALDRLCAAGVLLRNSAGGDYVYTLPADPSTAPT